jgi:hypothetical protein
VKFRDIVDSYRNVDIDYTSLNHIIVEDNKDEILNTFLIAEDYYVRNFRYSTKYSSKLPRIKMLDVLLLLIFCPYAYFKNEGQYYHSFKLLRKGTNIEFKYLFSSHDIQLINGIREKLNTLVKVKDIEDPDIVKENKNILIKRVLELINKPRIRVITDPHWIELCEKYCKEMNDSINPMGITMGLKESNYIEDSSKETNDFLPKLQPLNFEEDMKLNTPEGIKEIEKDRDNYLRMRRKVLEKIERAKRLYSEQEASICCKNCKKSCGPIKNLEFLGNGVYKINGTASMYFDSVANVDELQNNMFVMLYMETYSSIPEEWIICITCQSILGSRDTRSYFYYVYDISDLVIKFPVMEEYKIWDPRVIADKAQIRKIEQQALVERERLLKEIGQECEVCGESFKDAYSYTMKHLQTDKHRERLIELMEATFI